MPYTYLLLLVFTLSYPLFKSFEDKLKFREKWKFLFPGIVISAALFITWDIWFTHLGVWSFNHDYVLGLFICGLPIEEWLFFFIVPFSCIFIHEVMLYFVKGDPLNKVAKYITTLLIASFLLTAVLFSDRIYTFITFLLLGILLFVHQFILRSNYMGKFYLSWSVCFVPFLLVNGVLTALPVVSYDSKEILGLHIYTIPFEDFFYGMLDVLMVVTVYEHLKQKNKQSN